MSWHPSWCRRFAQPIATCGKYLAIRREPNATHNAATTLNTLFWQETRDTHTHLSYMRLCTNWTSSTLLTLGLKIESVPSLYSASILWISKSSGNALMTAIYFRWGRDEKSTMMLTWWRGGNAGRRQNRGTRRVAPCEAKTESYTAPRIHHSETKLWTAEDDTSLQRRHC